MALLLITHDFGVVRHFADRIAVMKEGEIVEYGRADDIFNHPQHDYTKLLLQSAPGGKPCMVEKASPTLVETRNLKVWFRDPGQVPVCINKMKKTCTSFINGLKGLLYFIHSCQVHSQ